MISHKLKYISSGGGFETDGSSTAPLWVMLFAGLVLLLIQGAHVSGTRTAVTAAKNALIKLEAAQLQQLRHPPSGKADAAPGTVNGEIRAYRLLARRDPDTDTGGNSFSVRMKGDTTDGQTFTQDVISMRTSLILLHGMVAKVNKGATLFSELERKSPWYRFHVSVPNSSHSFALPVNVSTLNQANFDAIFDGNRPSSSEAVLMDVWGW